jgi:hypothetical protein
MLVAGRRQGILNCHIFHGIVSLSINFSSISAFMLVKGEGLTLYPSKYLILLAEDYSTF